MRLRLAAVFLLTALCLGWVLWGLDLPDVTEALRTFRWGLLLPIWGLYGLAHACRAQRFRMLIPRPLDYKASFSTLSIGYLALHVIPFRMGELVRPTLLKEQRDLPFGESLAAVVVERLLDVLLLFGMLLSVAWFVDLPARLEVQGIDVLHAGQRGAGVLLAVGAVGVTAAMVAGEAILKRTDRLPGGGMLRKFFEAMRALAAQPVVATQAFLLTVVIWALTVGAVWLQMLATPGLPARLDVALTTWAATLSGMTVLPTPGFFGGFEAACTAALTLFAVDPGVAGTFAIGLHLTQFAFTIALGGGFLLYEGLSLREVVARSQKA